MSHEYLFIACPNACGSTLWAKLIGTSPNASLLTALRHEGQNVKGAARHIPIPQGLETGLWTAYEEKFTSEINYDWPAIKALWQSNWDMNKAVLVEKSPPNVLRAHLLARHFQPSRFLFAIRNPYPMCEGIRRKNINRPTWEACATHWVKCARWQMRLLPLLENSIYFTYEELCDNPERVMQRLLEFIPALDSFDASRRFTIHSHHASISNLNAASIDRLSREDIEAINSVLRNYPEELRFHGYDLL